MWLCSDYYFFIVCVEALIAGLLLYMLEQCSQVCFVCGGAVITSLVLCVLGSEHRFVIG